VQFVDKHPNVKLDVVGGGLEMILDRVNSADVDFGIANLPNIPDTFRYHELFETRLKLIAPKKNPFFKGKRLTLEMISKAPLISFPHSSTLRPFIEKRFSENELELNVVLVLNNYDSVKKYVALGLGVSILDDYALTENDKKDLQIYSLDRFFEKRSYGIIRRKRKYLSPPAKAFIRGIKPDLGFK
jgi:DNA-binding transcriptional LysR family regulator